ncbi:cobalt-precorrin 5A acetaldehyde-lyase [Maridesulfovibrio ferrireducens]|uniref:Cobalt-precorrin 5A acetaldehyde-lyase n=1 Tax=Maridesulfovibrio ferrireducens TaxID=246191 RepID=A0A1G9G4B6_9BACT|nr:cobalt-precorrin 5A hydrolase [Maridesulfovibrio ferrireducens]SDK95544.1 cobalt-precorrin 5A acetaldehyde-lyase [Maridesulfovibrio ferrireducens]
MNSQKTAIYALTAKGADLARSIALDTGAVSYVLERYAEDRDISFTQFLPLIAETFSLYDSHIFIAASGIVVRAIAPHLKSKDIDPAVVVLDQKGQFAISLVSGHLGGANELTRMIAEMIGATAVITTATDCSGVPSIDMIAYDNELEIGDIGLIKHVNAALLDGEKVGVYDPESFLDIEGLSDYFYRVEDAVDLIELRCGVCVDWRVHDLPESVLKIYPQCLRLGVGCRRGVPAVEIRGLIVAVLADHGVAGQSIASMGTIDAKNDEEGMLEFAERMGLEINFFSADELDKIEGTTPSGLVMKHMGVGSVCEAAAMKQAGGQDLIIPKNKSARVTMALAKDFRVKDI